MEGDLKMSARRGENREEKYVIRERYETGRSELVEDTFGGKIEFLAEDTFEFASINQHKLI